MNKYLLILAYLVGCNDYSIGIIGDPGTPTVTSTKRYLQPSPIPGKGLECTTDEQCGGELICYKNKDSYVGLCAKVLD